MCFPWDIEQCSTKQDADRTRADEQIQYSCEDWHLCEKPGGTGDPGDPALPKGAPTWAGAPRASLAPGLTAQKDPGNWNLKTHTSVFFLLPKAMLASPSRRCKLT